MIERARRFAEFWARWPSALRWGLPVAWAATIWWLSSRSPSGRAPGVGLVVLFNSAHVVVFGMLGAMLHLALPTRGVGRFLLAAGIAAVYGAVDELHQAFVPGRQSSVFDWSSDAAGAVLAAAALTFLREDLRWAWRTGWAVVPVALASVVCATIW